MIEKTGIIYSENSDLSNSQTIEQAGEQSSITVPKWPAGTDLYVKAYCVESGQTYESTIEHYVEEVDYFYIKNETSSSVSYTISKMDNPISTPQWSLDLLTWAYFSPMNVTVPAGKKIYMRSSNGLNESGKKWVIDTNGNDFSIGGNLSTLVDWSNKDSITRFPDYFMEGFLETTNLHALKSAEMVTTGNITAIGEHSFSRVFLYAVNMTYGPDFSNITTIGDNGMQYCFEGCSGLTTVPDMSSLTTIGDYGMAGCYYGCTALTTAPDMSSLTTIGDYALSNAFENCSSLVTAPDLSSVTEIGEKGMQYCFEGCTALTEAPDMSSLTTIGDYGMNGCYYGCFNLEEVTAPNVQSWNTSIFNEWLRDAGTNVSGTKTAYVPKGVTIPESDSGVPSGWTRVEYKTDDYFYVENTYNGTNAITFTTTTTDPVTGTYADSIEYSKDKINWTTLTFVPGTPQTVTLNQQGEKLYLRNSTGNFNSTGYYTSIKGSESHDAGGDIMTLVDYTSQNPTVPERCFYYLFFNNTGLVSASSITMPSTVNVHSFTYMFRDCRALVSAPALPATTLASSCYQAMFNNCISLVTPPVLPATTMVSSCYRSLFNGCTSLTTAPVLPATILASSCYYTMFSGCSSLNEVTTYAEDISASSCLTNWLSGVAATGTFNNYGSATYPSGASGIPVGWTEVNS